MSEFQFGCGRGRIAERTAKRIDKIARKHDCCFVTYREPHGGRRYWFSGPNMGHPFDQAMARAVFADLDAAGLSPTKVAR